MIVDQDGERDDIDIILLLGCGVSSVFANFRRPKSIGTSLFPGKTWQSNRQADRQTKIKRHPERQTDRQRDKTYETGGSQQGEEARIIRGEEAQRGAWPWQVIACSQPDCMIFNFPCMFLSCRCQSSWALSVWVELATGVAESFSHPDGSSLQHTVLKSKTHTF